MKKSQLFFLILFVLLADQALKIWIKTTYPTGEVVRVFGFDWFRIHFIENSGMAWGWQWGNETGKVILTLFRLAAVVGGTWYLLKFIREKYSKGFLICAGLIYAGAAGNLIDSMFYGMIFDKGLHYSSVLNEYVGYLGVAELSGKGYGSFMHGSVVDMLYFPIISGVLPEWIPVFGGQPFEFFSPIFNIADAAISVGVITLLLFQKRLLERSDDAPGATGVTNRTVSDTTEMM
ncbi:MAG: lipoprotein signal peptidase [Chitinophagales bacterium]|jgi:signal peptidase II|nr:lipoprotein signal peptidase [Bacteroidota bacterium]NBR36919.1 lipoprotein signal peptidase [Chitinophagales bacterium]